MMITKYFHWFTQISNNHRRVHRTKYFPSKIGSIIEIYRNKSKKKSL